jgi:hypothetical protein
MIFGFRDTRNIESPGELKKKIDKMAAKIISSDISHAP